MLVRLRKSFESIDMKEFPCIAKHFNLQFSTTSSSCKLTKPYTLDLSTLQELL